MIQYPDELSIEVDDHEYGPVLVVRGDVDAATTPHLARSLEEALRARPHRLVVDLSETSHVDVSGVRALLEARVAAGQDTLIAVVASGPALQPLRESGLDSVMAVYPDLTMALVCTAAAVEPL
ncbi:STAS domain-containing protein [Nocardia sp. NPDC051030]|uniref:STAS domain-containing protein n=1 Tax=Nocardia sp. NPDC051030 TaxID=3155162 RepID=UPI00343FC1B3